MLRAGAAAIFFGLIAIFVVTLVHHRIQELVEEISGRAVDFSAMESRIFLSATASSQAN
jgi:hypothetical protein